VLHSHLLKRAVCSTADASATIAPWGYRFSPACDPAPLSVPVDKLIPSATTRVARYLANGISPSDSVGPSFLRFNLCQHVPAIASITWLTPPTPLQRLCKPRRPGTTSLCTRCTSSEVLALRPPRRQCRALKQSALSPHSCSSLQLVVYQLHSAQTRLDARRRRPSPHRDRRPNECYSTPPHPR
jgi:hypothetical protein